MSDEAAPQRDSSDTTEQGVDEQYSDQNREAQQQGSVPDHSEDRPTDPSPADESA